MEILIGAISSLLIQLYKRVKKCYGEKVVDNVIYFGLFIIALTWVWLTRERMINMDTMKAVVQTVLIAVGLYEILIKKIIKVLRLKG